MKRRYLSIIALAFVFGIATIFTSCKSEEEANAEAEAAAAEIENLFNNAMDDLEEEVASAVDTVNTTLEEASEAVEDATEAVEDAAEEVK